MRGDDRPYVHPSGLVEIPARSEMDDYASFAYTRNPDWPSGGSRIASYRATLDTWIRDFDGYHAEGLCLTTIFHPKVIGTPGRAALLERWIDHMTDAGGVWFATVATWRGGGADDDRLAARLFRPRVITVAFEAELAILAVAPGRRRPGEVALGRYLRRTRGVPRLLAELARRGTPSTWFVPSALLERYPEQVRAVRDAGHELANCGVALEDFGALDERRAAHSGPAGSGGVPAPARRGAGRIPGGPRRDEPSAARRPTGRGVRLVVLAAR